MLSQVFIKQSHVFSKFANAQLHIVVAILQMASPHNSALNVLPQFLKEHHNQHLLVELRPVLAHGNKRLGQFVRVLHNTLVCICICSNN